MPRRSPQGRWEGRIGVWPTVVMYGERRDKGGVCYLRWWVPGVRNWRWQSCKTKVRNERGVLDPAAQDRVVEMAKRRHGLLTGTVTDTPIEQRAPITLAGTWAVLTDPQTGRFPTKTPYRDSLYQAIADASKELGPDFAWMHFDGLALMRVTRRKVQDVRAKKHAQKPGYRGAWVLGASLITIMGVLRESKYLPAHISIPGGKRWRKDLIRYVTELAGGTEPEPQRLRYTLEESRRLIAAAVRGASDPRLCLIVVLGAELRLGQVRRAMRSHLDLTKGCFRSPGRGDKRGALVELTAGQLAMVRYALTHGYLRRLEQLLPDYPLCPQGMLIKDPVGDFVADVDRHGSAKPAGRRAMLDWWMTLEQAAEVPHIDGRAWYGVRRGSVDAVLAAGISPDGLQQLGGWGSDRMPLTVYRDQKKDVARAEAARMRAEIRGENVAESYPAPSTTQTPVARTDATTTAQPHD